MSAAGLMDQLVTIQQPSASVDSHGQRVEGAWTDVAEVWARAQPLRGREFFAAGQIQSEATVKFTIRYRADITGAMRVVWRGENHAIVAPPMDVEGKRVVLEMMCAVGTRDSS